MRRTYQMYDGTDVALVVGVLLSIGLAGLSLILAVIALGLFYRHRLRDETAAASLSGRWAVFLFVTAILCGISIPSGLSTYNLFEHRRGYDNPPSHVLAVAIASASGPLVAIIWARYWWRWRKTEPPRESGHAGEDQPGDLPRG